MGQERLEKLEQGLAKVTDAIIGLKGRMNQRFEGLEGKMVQLLDNLEAAEERTNQRLDKTEQILSILIEERTETEGGKGGERIQQFRVSDEGNWEKTQFRVSDEGNWGKTQLGLNSGTKSQFKRWVVPKLVPDREVRRNLLEFNEDLPPIEKKEGREKHRRQQLEFVEARENREEHGKKRMDHYENDEESRNKNSNWRKRKLEIPMFNGENPDSWIRKAEKYFSFYQLGEREKLEAAAVSFMGEAEIWFDWEEQNESIKNWEYRSEYISRLTHLGKKEESVMIGAFMKGWTEDIKTETMEKKHQEKTRKGKKIRRYVRRNKIKKKEEVMEKKILKKKKGWIAHVSCGSGGGPGKRTPLVMAVGWYERRRIKTTAKRAVEVVLGQQTGEEWPSREDDGWEELKATKNRGLLAGKQWGLAGDVRTTTMAWAPFALLQFILSMTQVFSLIFFKKFCPFKNVLTNEDMVQENSGVTENAKIKRSRIWLKLVEYMSQVVGIIFVIDFLVLLPTCCSATEYLYDILSKARVVKKRIHVLIDCNKTEKSSAQLKEFICKQLKKEIEVRFDVITLTRVAFYPP